MGAIGGIVDFRNGNVDFSSFDAIRRAQALRGRCSSTAYVDHGVAMFYNYDGLFGKNEPIISERGGYSIVMSKDSRFEESKSLIEAYRAYGVEFLGMLDLPFAIALYDSERRMLLLARDKKGRKPLFYQAVGGRVLFASEAKGLFAVNDSLKVNAQILSQHLTSPIGIYAVSDICPDVSELRAGECALFTEVGISRFFYRESQGKKISGKAFTKKNIGAETAIDLNADDVISSLCDSLVAFDIPQFDAYMPSLCRLFLENRDNELTEFYFKDPLWRKSISYSYERENRLSSFYGMIGVGIPIKSSDVDSQRLDAEQKMILSVLRERFYSFDPSKKAILRKIFGEKKLSLLSRYFEGESVKKEDTEQKIRILGMTCQAVEWSEMRDISLLIPEQRIYSYTD